VKCNYCGDQGHMQRNCPEFLQTVTCYDCGEKGHLSSQCPANGNAAKAVRTRECFNCGGIGHVASVCPSVRRGGMRRRFKRAALDKNAPKKASLFSQLDASPYGEEPADKASDSKQVATIVVHVDVEGKSRKGKCGDVKLKPKDKKSNLKKKRRKKAAKGKKQKKLKTQSSVLGALLSYSDSPDEGDDNGKPAREDENTAIFEGNEEKKPKDEDLARKEPANLSGVNEMKPTKELKVLPTHPDDEKIEDSAECNEGKNQTKEELEACSYNELRSRCKKMGLSAGGKKGILLKRIFEHLGCT